MGKDFFSTGLNDVAGEKVRPGGKPDMTALEDDTLPDVGKYEAYKGANRDPFCLSVYTSDGPANVHAAYQYFQYVTNDLAGRTLRVIFGFFVIKVRGRNLLPVVQAIKNKRCAFIQEYSQRPDWERPEKGDPVIESIEISSQASARNEMLEQPKNSAK